MLGLQLETRVQELAAGAAATAQLESQLEQQQQQAAAGDCQEKEEQEQQRAAAAEVIARLKQQLAESRKQAAKVCHLCGRAQHACSSLGAPYDSATGWTNERSRPPSVKQGWQSAD